jgi:hypothetical protein
MANTQVTDFLLSSIITVDPEIEAKLSGALEIVDGFARLTDENLLDVFTDFIFSGGSELTSLDLSFAQQDTVSVSQDIVSTLVNPIAVPITSNSSSPVYARTPSNTVATISDTQPTSYSVTPVGIEPPSPFRGQYPYVHTMKSESGHIREVDDTPGHERTLDYHCAGTYEEIDKTGRRVVKVVGDDFKIIVQDQHIYIEGTHNLYVKGNINITCLNDVHINSGGRLEINAAEDVRIRGKSVSIESTSGDINMYSGKNFNTTSAANTNMTASANFNLESKVDMNVIGLAYKIKTKSFDLKSDTYVDMQAGDNLEAKLGGDFVVSSVKSSIKSSGALAIDAATISMQNGESTDATDALEAEAGALAKKTGLSTPPSREGSVPSVMESLVQGLDDDPDSMESAVASALESGRLSQEELDVANTETLADGPTDEAQGKLIAPIGSTGGIEKYNSSAINDALPLSQHYKLAHLSTNCVFPYKVIDQVAPSADRGGRFMTKAQIAANLSLLSQNVLEPIRAKFGPIKINSGVRSGPNIGGGQHGTGQAVDITYGSRSTDPATMLEIAKWIRDNVAFDQLILEYGKSQIWTHVSFAAPNSGCKWTKNRGEVKTCPNAGQGGKIHYVSGLQPLAWRPK